MYYILNMPQDVTFVGAKKLSTKTSTIINSTFAHVTFLKIRYRNLNKLMYFQ